MAEEALEISQIVQQAREINIVARAGHVPDVDVVSRVFLALCGAVERLEETLRRRDEWTASEIDRLENRINHLEERSR
jgi:hypothetical protein